MLGSAAFFDFLGCAYQYFCETTGLSSFIKVSLADHLFLSFPWFQCLLDDEFAFADLAGFFKCPSQKALVIMTTLDVETNFLEQRAWFLPRNSPSTLSCCICFLNIRVTNVPDCMGTMLGLKCRKVQFVLTFFVFRPTFLRNFQLDFLYQGFANVGWAFDQSTLRPFDHKIAVLLPSCSFVGQVELQKTLSRFSVRNLQKLLFWPSKRSSRHCYTAVK